MSMAEFYRYQDALVKIEALETLRELKISEYPMMKEDARSKFHREIAKKASIKSEQKVYTMDEIDQIFGG